MGIKNTDSAFLVVRQGTLPAELIAAVHVAIATFTGPVLVSLSGLSETSFYRGLSGARVHAGTRRAIQWAQ